MKNKVILISIDGMRSDGLLQCGNPYLKTLEQICSYSYDSRSLFPTVTFPCHFSMTHSVTPQRHGILTNIYVPQVRPVQGIFERVRQFGGTTALFYNWDYLRDLATPGGYTITYYSDIALDDRSDDVITDACLTAIDRYHPDFVMLYMVDVDEKGGHDNGWMSEEYLRRISIAIDNVKRVIETCGEEYSIIITADHGGHDRNHGLDIPEDMIIPVFLYGKAFKGGKTVDNTSLLDITPTIADLMGIEPVEEWEGRSLVEA